MSYGLVISDAAGTVRLSEDETVTRKVAELVLQADFVGSISVPNFDSSKGIFVVTFDVRKYKSQATTNTTLADGGTMWFHNDAVIGYDGFDYNSLVWDNVSKILEVSEGQSFPNFTPVPTPEGRVRIVFIHYQ